MTMRDDGIKRPENCHSMADLRTAIDALDEELVALLARRQAYIERAAILKVSRDQIRDIARIEDVIAKVVAAAEKTGLSPAIAESVWRSLIEASIGHEYRAFDNKR
jgi:isochorismate pyruvate lyase